MRQQSTSVDNNFVKGIITEATGLNYPPNACTQAINCVFSQIGDITRRPGLDLEPNSVNTVIAPTDLAFTSYVWKNAGGDGLTQILVQQTGNSVLFYLASAATILSPLSAHRLVSTVPLDSYATNGTTASTPCDFTDGNGYLFIFHPNMTPLYCSYSAGTIIVTPISIQIRDFNGTEDGLAINQRPGTLSAQHQYKLQNHGWTAGAPWISLDVTTADIPLPQPLGSRTFTIDAGLPITNGDNVQVFASSADPAGAIDITKPLATGSVTSYSSTSLTLNIYSAQAALAPGNGVGPFTLMPVDNGYINTWFTDIGNYPSNADVWWLFKNIDGDFDPATTSSRITLNTGPAPDGHYILDAFNQQRDLVSGITGLTDVTTTVRPKTGVWFQGRVWYAGPDASQAATGDQLHYSWSEHLYFSQIIENVGQFGYCYSNNDPTSEDFADLLPSDGGVIRLQGCGSIHKLVPVQNGLLAHTANGIKFITGSQGIGFTANDYTVTDISDIRALSGSSFVKVLGYPMFWNEEGIYSVAPSEQGQLSVNNLCIGTILTDYAAIPQYNKNFVRGAFDPLNYTVTWLYKSTGETSVDERYTFDSAIIYNIVTKGFSFHSFGDLAKIRDIKYITTIGGDTVPDPKCKYFVNVSSNYTYAELSDTTNWVDFISVNDVGSNYVSSFTTGYKIKGEALRRWQPMYVYVYTDNASSYKLQGIWDYATSGDSGRYSSIQVTENYSDKLSVGFKRHKIRGHGHSLQFKYTSVDGEPFNILGWATVESSNATI